MSNPIAHYSTIGQRPAVTAKLPHVRVTVEQARSALQGSQNSNPATEDILAEIALTNARLDAAEARMAGPWTQRRAEDPEDHEADSMRVRRLLREIGLYRTEELARENVG